jgi:CRISPR/Cas system-associated exonuclease Cas4 (RecB family)
MGRCAGKKGDGTPCERIVGSSQEYCYAHDPAFTEDRKRAASKAARSPAKGRSNMEIREIKAQLKDLYAAVLEGRAERAAAAVANQIANTQLRAIELERRVHEQDELEERLDELADLLEEAERATTHARW